MALFSEYRKYKNKSKLSPHLFWEYDMESFDFQKSKELVVQRVIERGDIEDYYAALNMYGGIRKFKEIIKNISHLSERDINFVCVVFNLKKEDLKCYRKTQLRKKLFNFDLECKNTLKGSINGIKIDCITYKYDNLKPVYQENGIRLLCLEDIIPMKLSSIIDNGSRLKDFVDIAYLGEMFTFNQMIEFYNNKYHRTNCFIPAKAITYFNDIDFSEPVFMIHNKFNWKDIEKRLHNMVKFPNKLIKQNIKTNKIKL